MASQNSHKEQAEHNESLLEEIDHKKFPDWYGVVAFYAAIHWVESLFAKHHTPSKRHYEREGVLREHYQDIWRHYRPLLDYSIKARYHTNRREAYLVKERLVDVRLPEIKRLVEKHLGASGKKAKKKASASS